MSNVISITTKVAKKMKPPVRKAELVEALAIRLVDKNRELYDAAQVAVADAEKELKAHCLDVALKSTVPKSATTEVKTNSRYVRGDWHSEVIGVEVRFVVEDSRTKSLNDKLEKLRAQYWSIRVPSINDAKRIIRDKMDDKHTPAERVTAMLNDTATVKQLDAQLEAMSKPTQIAIAG
jgi:hypothetical protein